MEDRKIRTDPRKALTFLLRHLLIHSIVHQHFTEHLLCARPCSKYFMGPSLLGQTGARSCRQQ